MISHDGNILIEFSVMPRFVFFVMALSSSHVVCVAVLFVIAKSILLSFMSIPSVWVFFVVVICKVMNNVIKKNMLCMKLKISLILVELHLVVLDAVDFNLISWTFLFYLINGNKKRVWADDVWKISCCWCILGYTKFTIILFFFHSLSFFSLMYYLQPLFITMRSMFELVKAFSPNPHCRDWKNNRVATILYSFLRNRKIMREPIE